MGEHPWLIVQSVGIICSISCFNATGVAITKHASAAQRSTVDTCRTLLIWIMSLIFLGEEFLPLEILGFILLVAGTLVYNEIVIVPIGFMKKNTKEELAKRENGSLDGNVRASRAMNYMSSSPQAAYDQQRNLRMIDQAKNNDRQGLIDKHNRADEDVYINEVTEGSSYNKQ
mgnify:CR=1 FL=1